MFLELTSLGREDLLQQVFSQRCSLTPFYSLSSMVPLAIAGSGGLLFFREPTGEVVLRHESTSTLGSPPLSALCHSLACSLTPSRLFFFFGSLFLDRFSLLRSNLFYDYYLICEMP